MVLLCQCQGSHHREWLRLPCLDPSVSTDRRTNNPKPSSWKAWRSIMDGHGRLTLAACCLPCQCQCQVLVCFQGYQTVTYGPITYYCGPVIRVSCASPPQSLPPALPESPLLECPLRGQHRRSVGRRWKSWSTQSPESVAAVDGWSGAVWFGVCGVG